MEDLSLHIMDIVDNSLRAGARNILITLEEDPGNHTLDLHIEDDGEGMDEELLKQAVNPFYTTKEGKKFGLGLSLLSQACTDAGGRMQLEPGKDGGLKLTASFDKSHVDMKPLGNIPKTLKVLKAAHPDVHVTFQHIGGEAARSKKNEFR